MQAEATDSAITVVVAEEETHIEVEAKAQATQSSIPQGREGDQVVDSLQVQVVARKTTQSTSISRCSITGKAVLRAQLHSKIKVSKKMRQGLPIRVIQVTSRSLRSSSKSLMQATLIIRPRDLLLLLLHINLEDTKTASQELKWLNIIGSSSTQIWSCLPAWTIN